MSFKKAAFIVCNNGLGHFTRVSRVISQITARHPNLLVDLFCAEKHIKIKSEDPIVIAMISNPNIKMHFTAKNIAWQNQAPSDALSYDESLYSDKAVQQADIVVSDNITEVLAYREDTIMMGSFLWSEVFQHHYPANNHVKAFVKKESDLLGRCNPTMICLEDFAMDGVKAMTNHFGINCVLDYQYPSRSIDKIKSVLISGGGTDTNLSLTMDIVNALEKTDLEILVPERLAAHYSDRVKRFDFSEEAFRNLDLIVARAGIGTITDAIKYKLPIVCIGGDDNLEIQFNSQKVDQLGYGLNAASDSSKAVKLINSLTDIKTYRKLQHNLEQAQTNGLDQIVNFLESRL